MEEQASDAEFGKNFTVNFRRVATNDRAFVNSEILVGSYVIGDFQQPVLMGSYTLALNDCLHRLEALEPISFGNEIDIERIFSEMDEIVWKQLPTENLNSHPKAQHLPNAKNSIAIPIYIESFDGEMAYYVRHGEKGELVWRDWESKTIKHIQIEKNRIISEYRRVKQSLLRG